MDSYRDLIYFKIWPDLGVFADPDYRLDIFSSETRVIAYRVTEDLGVVPTRYRFACEMESRA